MPYITTRHQGLVTHIGHLDRSASERRPTADGPGIAVSTNPEDWRRIAGLNGPEYTLEYAPAQWVDILSFTGQDLAELTSWMLMRRYMRPVTAWSVTAYDETRDDFIDFRSLDRAAAAAKVNRTLEAEIAACERGEGAVSAEETYQLTKRAMAGLGGRQTGQIRSTGSMRPHSCIRAR